MKIRTPYNYDELMRGTSKMYLYKEEVTSYSEELPSGVDLIELSVTESEGVLIGIHSGSTFKDYDYRSIYLTNQDSVVLAVIILDTQQYVKSKSLTIRLRIQYSYGTPERYIGNVSLVGSYSENNPYTAPETTTIIQNRASAVANNEGQPIWKNLIVKNNQYFNPFTGISFDKKIQVVLPSIAEGIPAVEIRTEDSVYKLDLKNKISYTNSSSSPEGFVHSSLPTNSIGFINLDTNRSILTNNSIPYIPEGAPFIGIGLNKDVIFVKENPIEFLGITFKVASRFLGKDVTQDDIQKFMSSNHTIFRDPITNKTLVIRKSNGLISYFSCPTLFIYPLKDNLILGVENIYDSEWNVISSPESLIEVENNKSINSDVISMYFFNQKYTLVGHQTRISNII